LKKDVQSEGIIGKLVSGMIRRTVRARFRTVYWKTPVDVPEQCIFVANHHGWHDGYLLFQVVNALERRSLDWIQEFQAFPLFGKVGGLPFPANQPEIRAASIKKTIKLMNEEKRSLILFGEGILHRGPEVWEIGKALELVLKKVPNAKVIPVGIRYDMSLHERPEVFLELGEPLERSDDIREKLRQILQVMVNQPISEIGYEILVQGTKDVNERFSPKGRN
jgi:1-acyl-sn-glycerol-3-phosphate acyltransferase